ncbi:Hypothetical protein A7982_11196 [Minicystis rosea]|nr:Hypothetical protein A7982_11196 [Minicystis rosea]
MAFAVLAPARPAAAGEALALTRVLLSSAGVGYFEYEAKVQGDADLPLVVPLDQVDDVLKSIVVYDNRGSVGQVTLPGKELLDRAFRDLPFDESALSSEPELLNALRGADVRVTTESGTIEGRVLSVTSEKIELPDKGGTTRRHRLALAAGGTVTSVLLEDVLRLRFVDPTLQRQLDSALAALLAQKERERRTLTIHSVGKGDRVVRVGYVVAVPLWKSTYRLTLSADPTVMKGALQGWAVVENQSGADWKDVDLTLVSGNPVTFKQALYASYFVRRPEIPVEVMGRVLPRLDDAAESVAARDPSPPPSPAGMVSGSSGPSRAEEAPDRPEVTPATSTELLNQVVFHLPKPVSIPDGEDALILVIEREIGAERVSLYQPDVEARHPLASVELTNDGVTGLPPGAMTTYVRSEDGTVTYAGDARLPMLPRGEKRIASFGVDLKVGIDKTQTSDQLITSATIDAGVLHLTRTERRQTHYTITGSAEEPRTVILEQPRIPGFDIGVSPPEAKVAVTDNRYRIRVVVPAGGRVSVEVTLDHPVLQHVAIADLGSAELGAYASSSALPAPLREALAHVAALRQIADEKAAAVKELEAELARITGEQARIRENLKAVPPGDPLAQRYLRLLGQAEDRIATLGEQLDAARRAVKDARKALSDYIRSLKIP